MGSPDVVAKGPSRRNHAIAAAVMTMTTACNMAHLPSATIVCAAHDNLSLKQT